MHVGSVCKQEQQCIVTKKPQMHCTHENSRTNSITGLFATIATRRYELAVPWLLRSGAARKSKGSVVRKL